MKTCAADPRENFKEDHVDFECRTIINHNSFCSETIGYGIVFSTVRERSIFIERALRERDE